MTTTDPIERAKALMDQAARERDAFRAAKATADLEIHQLRKRLARTEDAQREAEQLSHQLKQQIERLEQEVARSRTAMLDHAART